MKNRKPAKTKPAVRELGPDDLARTTAGDGIFKLKQHVDNPGQTPM